MAPAVNGRHTGTVPKTKTRNDSAQGYISTFSSHPQRSNVPNNLAFQDRHIPSTSLQQNQKRSRKTSNTQIDSSDAGLFDLSRPSNQQLSLADDDKAFQEVWSVHNSLPGVMNGRELSMPRNMMLGKDNRSNISKPDRVQVVSRLNKIRDYIQQTTTLMDALKASGDTRHEIQRQKLAGMLDELQDSESKLQAMAEKLENVEQQLEQCNQQNVTENGSHILQARSNSHSDVVTPRENDVPVSAAVSAKHNELKMLVEVSQKKLQALQEHQEALLALREKAKEQLEQAKQAQRVALAHDACEGSGDTPSADVLQDVQNLQQRLSNLHELYDNRNQLMELLGERDEVLESEHSVLQDKLTELQSKKKHMDRLLAQFSALSSVDSGNLDEDCTENRSDDDDDEQDNEIEHVQNKIAELSVAKTQLAQLKKQAARSRRDSDMVTSEANESELEVEDVNLSHPLKPDNINSQGERSRDIHNKAIKLHEAKTRLQQLQQLLTTVVDIQNRGQPVPQHYLDQLAQETSSDDGSGRIIITSDDSSLGVPPDIIQERVERTSFKEKKTNTQVDTKHLQARRRELEQLMRKEQVQPASINQAEMAEVTSNTNWGNSTQMTLDDLEDARGGFSSDDGHEEDPNYLSSHISLRNTQSRSSSRNARKEIEQSTASNRDAVDVSVDSAVQNCSIRPSPHNVWRKPSIESNVAPSRTMWTPSSPNRNINEDGMHGPSATINQDYESNLGIQSNLNLWQQSMLYEQQKQQLGTGSYYQQLLAASQVQQQQALLTTVNQCCHMLWAQQREIAALRSAVVMLQERIGNGIETVNTPVAIGIAEEPTLLDNSPQNLKSTFNSGLFPLADSVASAHSLPNLAPPLPTLPLPQMPLNNRPSVPPALNNQVPPGNRANNYWDNFRSYSRQNLLSSSSSKTNESPLHSTPLTERSHNPLHRATSRPHSQQASTSTSSEIIQTSPVRVSACKEKLNTHHTEINSQQANTCSSPRHSQDSSNCHTANARTPINRQKKQHSFSENVSEAVYSEFSSLLAVNENQPQFVLQLLRDLKLVNSDMLRQAMLQNLRNFLTEHLSQNVAQSSSLNVETSSREHQFSDDEDNAKGGLVGYADEMSDDNLEGATALPPRNAAWNKDTLELPGRGGSKLDWEVHAVLVDIFPFLKTHLDDTCTPALLEAVRILAVQLVPPAPPGGSLGQLEALLEDALLKFQGCRLRDVGEELLTVIADVVQSELTFLRLVDTVRREADQESVESVVVNIASNEGFLVPNNQHHSELPTSEEYNGDLAEADQSRHEDGTEILSHTPDQFPAIEDESQEIEVPVPNSDEVVNTEGSNFEAGNSEAEAQWNTEQGLDQVPSRLHKVPDFSSP